MANGFERITDIEVWKLDQSTLSPEELNARQVVAMVDLGEDRVIVSEADSYTRLVLPASDGDLYDDPVIESQLRDGNVNPREFLTSQGLADDDYLVGKFKKLIENRDYVLDDVLGYISLTQRLQESEAIAVAFRYVAAGRVETIGDFSTETGGSTGGQNEKRLALKLLKPVNLRQPALDQDFNPAAWYLELRNIYRLPARGLNPNDFELQIEHQPPGKPASKVVTDLSPNRQTLLQQLGLDRLNVDGAIQPDDKFDYLTNYTIDPSTGKLIFPYLQPFGSRIRRLIASNTTAESEIQRKIDTYVFAGLYTQKKEKARRDFPQYDVYLLRGSYKGSVQEFYDLRAFAGLVEGSVRVTSGGSRLTEGSDFVVDYQGGTVTITNPAYLSAGRDIDITYEQNSFFNLQKKTLLGARADYNFGENLALGGTIFNLNQKSPIDKFRIGEEPISNTIWGLDGTFDLQPHWLTRAIDALPFIQTKAPSSIHVTGEFAQLRPGASQTVAFDRSRNKLMESGRDFNSDELRGISYLDDFEGFENTYSLRQPGAWRVAAAPDGIRRYPSDLVGSEFDALRTHWRGSFGWYSVQRNVIQDFVDMGSPVTAATAPVEINDVFPEKDTRGQLEDFITTLDLYFNPHQRGPYNYTPDLKDFLQSPKDVWGGMVQRLPEGYTDFSLKNIEFIEFIIRPFAENGEASRDARLYVDIGSISEDVLPNGKLNTEDGITTTTASQGDLDEWGRLSRGTQNSTIDVDESLRRTEDLGLDGLASYDVDNYEPLMTEQFVFQDFLASLDPSDPDPRYRAEVAKAQRDPSGDDFFYFGADYFRDPTYFPGGASIQERFLHYFPGMEINSFEAQQKLAPSIHGKRGNSRTPDSEDLNLNSAVDTENSYFQYELPLTLSVLDSLAAPNRVDD
ncbi:MAG: cell surface protein SprA, partial [Rhodothermales bacterium]